MARKTEDPTSLHDAFEVSLKLLTRAAQTEAGLRQKLQKRQFVDEVIEATIVRLKKLQFINDEKFAADYVAYRSRTSPLGAFHLQQKLMLKGISKDMAKQVTSTISSEDELDQARTLAEKRMRSLGRFEPVQQKLKLARFLAARGFRSSTVYAIIHELLS